MPCQQYSPDEDEPEAADEAERVLDELEDAVVAAVMSCWPVVSR